MNPTLASPEMAEQVRHWARDTEVYLSKAIKSKRCAGCRNCGDYNEGSPYPVSCNATYVETPKHQFVMEPVMHLEDAATSLVVDKWVLSDPGRDVCPFFAPKETVGLGHG